ncbi:MAG TPA: PRC-barrel domain-containing protein, partial [Anaerolineales bacterium]|nr:PRC-barrel domain-containing protein [Anaerolineales bacterium]
MNEYPRVVQVSKVIGNKVVNPSGELLGNLKELVLDLEEERIAYAVLSFGGFMGLGDKLFAIPWEALVLNPK